MRVTKSRHIILTVGHKKSLFSSGSKDPPPAPLVSVWGPERVKLRLQVPKDQFRCCSFHESAFLKGEGELGT